MVDRPSGGGRPRRAARLIVVALLSIGALVGCFVAGRMVQPPDRSTATAARATIAVDATVERRSVDSRTAFSGKMQAGTSVIVLARSLPPTPIVTRQTLPTGSTFVSGNLVSVISGEPYFALTGPLPLYRDLRTGDKGDDVTALQRALNTTGADISETGWVNWDTLHAVSELYEAAGFDIPKEPAADGTEQNVIHIANFVDAGTQSGVVTATAPVGTIVDDSTALATISVSQNYATFRADAVVSATLKAGDPLTVQAGNTNFDTTIAAVGDFADGTETQLPGRDVTLRSSDPAFTGLPPGTPVTVLAGGAVSDSLAIPLTAVRQDNDGDYVLRKEKDSDGKTTYKRVAISISTTGAGWAGLADGSLEQGDEVRIT